MSHLKTVALVLAIIVTYFFLVAPVWALTPATIGGVVLSIAHTLLVTLLAPLVADGLLHRKKQREAAELAAEVERLQAEMMAERWAELGREASDLARREAFRLAQREANLKIEIPEQVQKDFQDAVNASIENIKQAMNDAYNGPRGESYYGRQ